MKKTFIFFVLVLLSSISSYSQVQSNEYTLGNFTEEKDGIFYILIPIDESLSDQGVIVLNNLKEEKGFTDLRLSKFWLDDPEVKSGKAYFILIRRFKEDISAKKFLKVVDENFSLSKGNSVIISQNNYRILLEKQNFEEYKEFIKKGE